MRYVLILWVYFFAQIPIAYAQSLTSFTKELYDTHSRYKVDGFDTQRVDPNKLQLAINQLTVTNSGLFEVNLLGYSVLDRPIQMISIGQGPVDVLMWSQMHGNESTATRSMQDLLNFFERNYNTNKNVVDLLKNLRIHFIPMLNPDGAFLWTRENALGIDLNRDALRLIAPESQILKRVRDSLEADYGFNLHDQSRHYNVYRSDKTASISFLATAFDYEKSRSAGRDEAMQLISYLYEINQQLIPNHTGRYNDDFEPRAFGDNIQKWGTKLILIETGGFKEDPEKQKGRMLNAVLIGSALEAIAKRSHLRLPVEYYYRIPENDRKLFDLKISNLLKRVNGKQYMVDLGYNYEDNELLSGTIVLEDQGDLSTYSAYRVLDGANAMLTAPKYYSGKLSNYSQELDLINRGYLYYKKSRNGYQSKFMIETRETDIPEDYIERGQFFLQKNSEYTFIILRGKVIDIKLINN